jgi:pyruvate/2-oxoglutarate/acetoin dehydrogenase E1 component
MMGYGISVPKKYQTTKGSISEALKGFQQEEGTNGLLIYNVRGWDYAGMCEAFEEGIRIARESHTPVLFHVEEITQPQGHSTSGSHERYKTAERLQWERMWDGRVKMREWIIANMLAGEEELDDVETGAKEAVRRARAKAWEQYLGPVKAQVTRTTNLIAEASTQWPQQATALQKTGKELTAIREPLRRHVMQALHAASLVAGMDSPLMNYYNELLSENRKSYNSHLYNEGAGSPLRVEGTALQYNNNAPALNGYEILNRYFDQLFADNPKVLAFGEDLGFIGDVNQGFSGLQAKYGAGRIFDTGIRELTIMGQGIGMAMRGLRPIAEIQYIDYLLYGLQPLSDDAASLHYRTKGQQSCPLIVRTRGHRLEGIWHSGSPMGMMLGSLQGFWICVPRNMTQAVGMYNTLLQGADPAVMVESLNGYRLKEKLPSNLLDYTVALGVPEVLLEGSDITLVSYGSTLRIVLEAAQRLRSENISAEVIDVQTLLPFDRHHKILESLKKTGRIVFIDEDVPGGASSFMFTHVIEKQGGYRWLDAAPRTLTAEAHRPAYGSDGDYFSKPNKETIQTLVRQVMAE